MKKEKHQPPATDFRKTFLIVGVFAVAMGFLEAIVVVYLRQVYYPEGFDFPLTILSPEMISVEWIRELATLVMLAAVGILAGKSNLQRLLYFLFSFAIWDIFYYVALYLLLDWPQSLLTWDILFLIPVPWIGPVLSPVICSLTMIFMALTLIPPLEIGKDVRIKLIGWILILSGASVILFTYIRDYLLMISGSGLLSGPDDPREHEIFWSTINTFTPDHYNWPLFIFGELLILTAIAITLRQIKKTNHEK